MVSQQPASFGVGEIMFLVPEEKDPIASTVYLNCLSLKEIA